MQRLEVMALENWTISPMLSTHANLLRNAILATLRARPHEKRTWQQYYERVSKWLDAICAGLMEQSLWTFSDQAGPSLTCMSRKPKTTKRKQRNVHERVLHSAIVLRASWLLNQSTLSSSHFVHKLSLGKAIYYC